MDESIKHEVITYTFNYRNIQGLRQLISTNRINVEEVEDVIREKLLQFGEDATSEKTLEYSATIGKHVTLQEWVNYVLSKIDRD